ncbi:transglutaminase-like cysteine peptidase [Agrobacterium sp. rho-13.3]|jgi:predicted transglutaminase-like cysteine proteinase|uniref:transglutaminase-like cysteine peptidase n=1 Tax=Agrobacterium sp. rho-13.3 TaxID=3072980 RepID=UPI002A155862|nr:transglutaminase-like cysteine peptidase [Agrobacterium sp. rho-13.3]MDX8311340.1 transglutaminase-like cysteine peptidase [Agrobacterium sp. rho-13.3]
MKIFVLISALLGAATLCSNVSAGQLQATRSITAPEGFTSACQRYSWLCATKAGVKMGDADALELLNKVNRQVNAAIRPAEDSVVYGRSNFWSLPKDGRGDCEDYAMAKTKALMDAGFPANKMSISVVLDRSGGNHAVLMVRLSDGDYVLDNMTSSIKSWDRTGYTYLARQKFNNKAAWEVILAGPRAGQFSEI